MELKSHADGRLCSSSASHDTGSPGCLTSLLVYRQQMVASTYYDSLLRGSPSLGDVWKVSITSRLAERPKVNGSILNLLRCCREIWISFIMSGTTPAVPPFRILTYFATSFPGMAGDVIIHTAILSLKWLLIWRYFFPRMMWDLSISPLCPSQSSLLSSQW